MKRDACTGTGNGAARRQHLKYYMERNHESCRCARHGGQRIQSGASWAESRNETLYQIVPDFADSAEDTAGEMK